MGTAWNKHWKALQEQTKSQCKANRQYGSTYKVFEEFILTRILEIQEEINVDITGKNRIMLTFGLQLQSLIARVLDDTDSIIVN